MQKLVFFLLMAISQLGLAEESMCDKNEAIVFSCHIGKKVVSLCHVSNQAHNLTYRYGVPGAAELVYPDSIKGKSGDFYASENPLYGGASTTVAFKQGHYEYRIYSKVGREEGEGNSPEDRIPVFEDGLIISKGGKLLKQMVCDDGGSGFREDVDWLAKR